MRVYIPLTIDELQTLHDDGRIPGPVEALAVTDDVKAGLGDLSDEEAEFAVTTAAAEASRTRLTEALQRTGRRVVVVAEVSDTLVAPAAGSPGLVELTGDVERRRVAAVLADPAEVDLTSDVPDELAWFATQEITDLLA